MGGARRGAIALLLSVSALVSGAATPGAADAPTDDADPVIAPVEPMSWWGYWTGIHAGDRDTGIKYVKQKWPRKFGTNFLLTGTNVSLEETVRTVRMAHDAGTGVILYLGTLLGHGCSYVRGYDYGQADYEQWDTDLETLAGALAPYDDAIVAIVGFDDMNGTAPICLKPADNEPSPVSESMRLTERHFPDVEYRGHVWMAGGWADDPDAQPHHPDWLEYSTMLFPYSYHGYFPLGWNRNLVTDCPHEGDLPRSRPPDSYATRNVADVHAFIDWVNAQPGHEGTPVLYIGAASQSGYTRQPIRARGIACTFDSTFYHLRCLSAADPSGWAGQVRGVMGFAWNSNAEFGPLFSWIGAAKVPEQKQAGRWLAKNRDLCRFSAQRDYEDGGGEQRYWRWRYEECAVDPALTALGSCTRLTQRDGDAWTNGDGVARVDATTLTPPVHQLSSVARRWTAPADGTATIRFRLADRAPVPPCVAFNDDGARVAVYLGTTQVWPAAGWQLVRNGAPLDVTIPDLAVHAGDPLRFLVQGGTATTPPSTPGCDATDFAPDIDFRW